MNILSTTVIGKKRSVVRFLKGLQTQKKCPLMTFQNNYLKQPFTVRNASFTKTFSCCKNVYSFVDDKIWPKTKI